jgi:hypothetical protein
MNVKLQSYIHLGKHVHIYTMVWEVEMFLITIYFFGPLFLVIIECFFAWAPKDVSEVSEKQISVL